ncbi:MAG: aspartate aminotransferase family protein [Alphaproteobacteria bacterium]
MTTKTPSSNLSSLGAGDVAHLLHPYTNLEAHEAQGPFVITRGDGVYVFDEDGKQYLEAMAGLWCTALGFSEPRLAAAAEAQMRRLPFYHLFSHKSHDRAIELAETLISMAPVPMSKIFFANSGSEAVDTAVKLVWYVNNGRGLPAKKKIITRGRAYHGVSIAAASLTTLPANQGDFDVPIAGIITTDCPHYYRGARDGESEEDFSTRLAGNLEKLILAEGPDTVAAFIAEPVMGAGGVIPPPAGYFDKVQKVLKAFNILFIADEVICGFGRTGNWFGCDTFSLKPDIITLAKALTSGYLPMAAVMINQELYQTIRGQSAKHGVFGHGFTYSGHPVPAAVALETLKIYRERDIIDHVRKVGPRLQDGLRAFAGHPLVGEVRGLGLIAAVELVRDKATKAPFDAKSAVGAYLAGRAQAHGLILRALGNTVAFSPPLIISEAEIDELLAKFALALDDTEAMVAKQG